MIGVGIGLLLANKLSRRQRKVIGLPLLIAGALSTIPIAHHLLGNEGAAYGFLIYEPKNSGNSDLADSCRGHKRCGQRPVGSSGNENVESQTGDTRFRVETVASGLEVPWGFAFLPNKDLLFTERPGRVRIIEGGKLRTEPVFTVPDVEPSSESGLMDISLHPNLPFK